MTNSVTEEEMELRLEDLSEGVKQADRFVNPLAVLCIAVAIIAIIVWLVRP